VWGVAEFWGWNLVADFSGGLRRVVWLLVSVALMYGGVCGSVFGSVVVLRICCMLGDCAEAFLISMRGLW
jgi:hypothetical protein